MPTIFVTSGGGLVGSTLCESLAKRGDKVVAFDLAISPRLQRFKSPLIDFRFGDMIK